MTTKAQLRRDGLYIFVLSFIFLVFFCSHHCSVVHFLLVTHLNSSQLLSRNFIRNASNNVYVTVIALSSFLSLSLNSISIIIPLHVTYTLFISIFIYLYYFLIFGLS